MHYYQFNIGDYISHTHHLTPMENLAYRLLLDLYYLHERPFNVCSTTLARQINLRDYVQEVEAVLSEFFVSTSEGWINKRADEEIAHYHGKLEQASKAGKASAAKRTINASSTDVQPNNNQEPINNKHKPLTNKQEPQEKQKIATATRLPADWKPTETDLAFCKTTRPDLNPFDVADSFVDYWIAQPGAKGRKASWPATWRTWVRNQRASNGTAKFLTAQQQRDENNRRSTAEFLADDTPFFGQPIEGEFSNV